MFLLRVQYHSVSSKSDVILSHRFGWIEERIAVIPRVERNEKCGRNSTGVSIWRADISTKFDVYCFKPAGNYMYNMFLKMLSS